jgi:hypothetical protein
MSHDDLKTRVDQRPFMPFRVIVTEGGSYDIRHPELFMLGKRSAVIGIAGNPADTTFDTSVIVDLLHIVRLEMLDKQPAGGNGAKP